MNDNDNKLRDGDRQTVALVFGNFNTLHLGHLRFLRFASEQADRLIVGLYAKGTSPGAILTDEERIEALRFVGEINEIVLVTGDRLDLIREIRPDVVVKGREFARVHNEEEALAEELGFKLIFGSGEPISTPVHALLNPPRQHDFFVDERTRAYIRRHQLERPRVQGILESFSRLNVLVLGDTIVDEYVDCDPVGLSQEDPTIVVSPKTRVSFLGGAGIVASHARGLGASVDFVSVVGSDASGKFAREAAEKAGVGTFLLEDETRPTTTKRRYRAGNKTLLRVNEYRQHDIGQRLKDAFSQHIHARLDRYDLVIFSDFNYGFLCNGFVQGVIRLAREKGIPMFADSQSSSQLGDLNKFRGMRLVTPTEHEARLTLKNTKDGLVKVSESLGQELQAENVFVTLGHDGVLIRSKLYEGFWDTDELPALNANPKDVAGAGDAMLVSSALALVAGATIWQAAFVGSVAAACQVSRVGNTALTISELLDTVDKVIG